jgi:hypothetical protein
VSAGGGASGEACRCRPDPARRSRGVGGHEDAATCAAASADDGRPPARAPGTAASTTTGTGPRDQMGRCVRPRRASVVTNRLRPVRATANGAGQTREERPVDSTARVWRTADRAHAEEVEIGRGERTERDRNSAAPVAAMRAISAAVCSSSYGSYYRTACRVARRHHGHRLFHRGIGRGVTWDRDARRGGTRAITGFDASHLPCRVAAVPEESSSRSAKADGGGLTAAT